MPEVEVRCLILHADSGVIVSVLYSVEALYSDSQEFWWREGNGSCDCNRYLYFCRHGKYSEDEIYVFCGDGDFGFGHFGLIGPFVEHA